MRSRPVAAFWSCLVSIGTLDAGAGPPRLDIPVRCIVGQECFIQNYVDRDPGPASRDYACGLLSYEGHTGTDFRLRNLRTMKEGVPVVAAAAGKVVGTRDGEPDVSIRDRPLTSERDAGNGVRLDHGDGWETQYSHLKNGSVRVRVGQTVAAGEVLGAVGLSGRTEFPHVHLTLRHDGRPVDPFAMSDAAACGDTSSSLWEPGALKAMGYLSSGVLDSGFSGRSLTQREVESGESFSDSLPQDADAVVFHVVAFGIRRDDVEESTLTTPSGRVLATHLELLNRDLAVRRVFVGKRRAAAAWPAGEYAGHYVLRRNGAVVAEATNRVSIVRNGARSALP